jgi:hypothetical protein
MRWDQGFWLRCPATRLTNFSEVRQLAQAPNSSMNVRRGQVGLGEVREVTGQPAPFPRTPFRETIGCSSNVTQISSIATKR